MQSTVAAALRLVNGSGPASSAAGCRARIAPPGAATRWRRRCDQTGTPAALHRTLRRRPCSARARCVADSRDIFGCRRRAGATERPTPAWIVRSRAARSASAPLAGWGRVAEQRISRGGSGVSYFDVPRRTFVALVGACRYRRLHPESRLNGTDAESRPAPSLYKRSALTASTMQSFSRGRLSRPFRHRCGGCANGSGSLKTPMRRSRERALDSHVPPVDCVSKRASAYYDLLRHESSRGLFQASRALRSRCVLRD